MFLNYIEKGSFKASVLVVYNQFSSPTFERKTENSSVLIFGELLGQEKSGPVRAESSRSLIRDLQVTTGIYRCW